MVATRIPDVVTALLDLAATTLDGWQVVDGPFASEDPQAAILMVGVGNSEDADPYRSTRDLPALGGRPRENITIRCQAATWHGDVDFASLRAGLVDALDRLDAALRAVPAVGGAANVRIGSQRWYQIEAPDGAGLGAHFDILATAFL